MPFGIIIGQDGKPICLCCRDMIWHCEKCWRKFHNSQGLVDDFEPPKYYGQSMIEDELNEEFAKMGVGIVPSIKADKNRIYKEGEYH